MTHYIISAVEERQYTASSKAREDIISFLKEEKFVDLKVIIPKSKIKRVLGQSSIWKDTVKKLKQDDVVALQYPIYSHLIEDNIVKKLKKITQIKKILIIHDVESLRFYRDNKKEQIREIALFNSFDTLIVHNAEMLTWLQENGVTAHLVNLELFDYGSTIATKEPSQNEPVVFAGNLSKSKFLGKLAIKKAVTLFGIQPLETYPQNIDYQGAFSPEDLETHLQGSFGLIWDGESVETCTGLTGEYMKYNNPHKASLYLSTGLPVIIWQESALSTFVEKHHLGLSIENLATLDETLAQLSAKEYQAMKENVQQLSPKIKSGYFIKKAIEETINQNGELERK